MSEAAMAVLSRAVRARLLPWFARQARDLPWRRNRTPYRVLVSELMLQQTRVDQAVPYFLRFVRLFPNFGRLAAADLEQVLHAWQGLGYYRRARHLHELAKRVTLDHRGRPPSTLEGLAGLPGVGPYTAAAVASLAFGLDAAVVDGNVRRVLCRLLTRPTIPPAEARELATALLPKGKAGAFNEAMMELGATVCTPRKPACGRCPMRQVCAGFRHGDPSRFPAPPREKSIPHFVVGAAVTVDRRGRILIARRRTDDMLGGLWEFPGGKREPGESMPECIRRELREELGIDTVIGPRLVVVKHAYSHFTIELHTHLARIVAGRPRAVHCAGFAWCAPADLDARPFSRADLRIIEALRGPGREMFEDWASGAVRQSR